MEKVIYGIHPSPFDVDMVIGMRGDALCWLGFMTEIQDGAFKGTAIDRMQCWFSSSLCEQDQGQTAPMTKQIITAWQTQETSSIRMAFGGTLFQQSVWQSLMTIPYGETVSYQDVANDIHKPKAARAVGTAVGQNPISLLIPCHRVIRHDGGMGNYGWGVPLKEKILKAECGNED